MVLAALLGSGPVGLAAEPGVLPRRASGGAAREAVTPPDPIGTATMEADGTIRLQLRAAGPGATGDALLRYRPGELGYAAIRTHLPALRPGLTLPVPPFP